MTPTLVQQIAGLAAGAQVSTLPEAVTASAKQRVLDIAGLIVAAIDVPTARAAISTTVRRGGVAEASVVGEPTLVPASSAAFANGVLAHSLDYDDTHLPSVLHPSAAVVPAALATAEAVGAAGEQAVVGAALGIETAVRLGMAGYDREARNSVFFEHGQHATSICGALGAAVASGRVRGLDADGIAHAVGIAASMASGIIESNRTGGTVKQLHCGFAARCGVEAAELAAAGVTASPTVLEGRFGFFQAWLHGQVDLDAVTDRLGEHWELPGIFFKPYPANHFTHTAVDAAAELRARGVRPEQIESIDLAVAGPTVRTIGEPIEVKRAPATGYQAQFSGPFMVAVGLLGGGGLGVSLADVTDERVADPRVREVMAKVSVRSDPRCDEIFPYQFPALLTARLTDGSEVTVEVLTNRGGPERPLSDAELTQKFSDNVAGRLPDHLAAQLRDACLDLDAAADVTELTAALRMAKGLQ